MVDRAPASRDVVTEAFRQYLTFLTTTPLVDEDSLYVPKGKWKTVDAAALRRLGKTDAVYDLLRHMPYIRESALPIAGNSTRQTDYYSKDVLKDIVGAGSDAEAASIAEDIGATPPSMTLDANVVCLTIGGREEIYLLLDVDNWRVREYNQNDGPRNSDGSYNFTPTGWRLLPERDMRDVLDEWKQKYINLEWIPVPKYHYSTLIDGLDDNDQLEQAAEVYEQYGWPGENFDKAACEDALDELWDRWQE